MHARTMMVMSAAVVLAGATVPAPALAQKLLASYPTLTTSAALQAAQAALARCQKDGYTVGVAVVDRGGQPLAVLRDNLAGTHTTQTAINKAATAASFRTDTAEIAVASQSGKPQSGVRQLPNVVAIAGGLVIRAKGSLVGGIGVRQVRRRRGRYRAHRPSLQEPGLPTGRIHGGNTGNYRSRALPRHLQRPGK